MTTSEPTPPHPVLDEYYRTEADRQKFVSDLFNGAAPYYERWGGSSIGARATGIAGGHSSAPGSGRACASSTSRPAPVCWREWRRASLEEAVGWSGSIPASGMLGEARKAPAGPLVFGRAEELPFRGDTFDMLSMGFALRHVPTLEVAFREYWRVLKPGGRMLLLEVSRPPTAVVRAMLRVHLQRILPLIMRIRTRSEPAEVLMKFYWDTIDQCVPPETILSVLRDGGFTDVERRVLWGFMSEYVAVKPLARG